MSCAAATLDPRLKSVLLATDLSPASIKPLHQALSIARHYEAKLYIAHVVSPVPYLMSGPEALELGREGAAEDVRQLQRDLLHQDSLNGLDHEFIIRTGAVWNELESIVVERQIDLVVVGTHGRRGIEKLLLGSVAEEVFRKANCPVLTVGPHSYREGHIEFASEARTYLFATDFCEASLAAIPNAVSLAARTKARLILVHVVPAAPIPQITGWYSASEIASMRENARMACLRRLNQLVPPDEQMRIEIESVVQFGIPSEKILQLALDQNAELVILGLRRSALGGTLSHLPWATAYEVVCGAGCPVLTLRH